MRSFVNISKLDNANLNREFPEVLELAGLEKVDAYNQYAVCVFDHWLSPEEAKVEIDQVPSLGEYSHNQNLYNFVVNLAGETITYLIKPIGKRKSKVTFRKFLSRSGLERTLRLKHHLISDSFRFVLLFPEIETIYFEGCDFTHHFYRKKNAEFGLIEEIAKLNNLFVLK